MKIFLGKFSTKNPEQIEKKYYAAGAKGNSWYGGVEVGDYVFASYDGSIIGLWRAKEYGKLKNAVNPTVDGVLLFEEVKQYSDVSVSNDFTRYKYFIHDLNMVNKVTKSLKGLGFIPITTTKECPKPEDIEFKNHGIDLYIALEEVDLPFKNGDIRVTINNTEEMRIVHIERYNEGLFSVYKEFNELYEERNKEDGKFTIRELSEYAVEDNATQKRNFLLTVIEEIEEKRYIKVTNPIRLYDNLLVGRKRSPIKPAIEPDIEPPVKTDDIGDYEEIDSDYSSYASLLNFNPNMILYGPPGTGKTFATNQIIDNFEKKYFNGASSYEMANQEDRVRTITFHQSYSYEEFIEGIRPVLNNDENGVGYRLEDGIFKELCINAGKELIKRKDNAVYVDRINTDSTIWKISLGERKTDALYNECLEKNEIAIGWLPYSILNDLESEDIMKLLIEDGNGEKPTQNANTINAFANEMKVGDIVLVYNSPETIRRIGIVNSDYFHIDAKDYTHRRKVEWLNDLKYPINIKRYNNNKILTLKTVYRLSNISVSNVINMILEHSLVKQSLEDKHQIKPYYIIIDEINRGNISKIFGELITLIEQDKRGREIVLPYSKKEFRVPNNLYIIGTMNTADRSIAAIDTALRRRFTFIELAPEPSVLAKYDNPIINDCIDLTKLMTVLNQRIMEKFDRDHRIGHAYFMGIESLNNLYQTWYYKILPLLSEYFYNDVSSLTYIVGNSFFDKHGNVQYLSMAVQDNGLSEFEEKLIAIYKGQEDERR